MGSLIKREMFYNNFVKKSAVTLNINGLVQGVCFRAATKDTADRLGIKGWVRNLPDGSVEALFEGSHDDLEKAVKWCHSGPPGARVYHIDEKWAEYAGDFDAFNIRYEY